MKIKNIEVYENGDKWVVAWQDKSSYYPEKSEAFNSKDEAIDFSERIKVASDSVRGKNKG